MTVAAATVTLNNSLTKINILLIMTKMAEKSYPLGHTYSYSYIREYPVTLLGLQHVGWAAL